MPLIKSQHTIVQILLAMHDVSEHTWYFVIQLRDILIQEESQKSRQEILIQQLMHNMVTIQSLYLECGYIILFILFKILQ